MEEMVGLEGVQHKTDQRDLLAVALLDKEILEEIHLLVETILAEGVGVLGRLDKMLQIHQQQVMAELGLIGNL